MLRNREFRILLLPLTAVALLFIGLGFLISPWAAALCAALAAVLICITVAFTVWRYRQISRLSDRLRRINAGDYSLDLQDEAEGELSILKSELYKTTVTLREQNGKLLSDKAALQTLLTDISHQLKTPLTSLFVMIDLLSDEALPQQRRDEFTGHIRTQLERLQWLVSALLKLSRLDAGTISFQPVECQAEELIEGALSPLLIPMELKGQTLRMEANEVLLRCDRAWTAEAVLNIAKNCVEHTPVGGTVTVRCSINPLFTQICVEDDGPGIDPADLPHIWDRFYRGRNAQGDSVGVGLALAAAIIQGQGGTVSAKRPPTGGSAFVIRLTK